MDNNGGPVLQYRLSILYTSCYYRLKLTLEVQLDHARLIGQAQFVWPSEPRQINDCTHSFPARAANWSKRVMKVVSPEIAQDEGEIILIFSTYTSIHATLLEDFFTFTNVNADGWEPHPQNWDVQSGLGNGQLHPLGHVCVLFVDQTHYRQGKNLPGFLQW